MWKMRIFYHRSVRKSAKSAQKACTFTQKKWWSNVRTLSQEY